MVLNKEWRKQMEDKESRVTLRELSELKEYLEGILQAHQKEIAVLLREEHNTKQAEEIEELKEKNLRLQQKMHLLERQAEEVKQINEMYQEKCALLTKECEEKDVLAAAGKKTICLLEQELDDFRKKNAEMQQESARVICDREACITSLEDRLNKYEKCYREIEEAFVLYGSLSGDLKMRLRNIFGTGSIYEFISAARDWNNIEGLWIFTKRRIVEGENEGVNCLVELFRFMFKAYSKHVNAKNFVMISPIEGERFDSDEHSIMGTKTDGKIAELLLDGICDAVTRKVVFKAIVKVI